MFTCSTDLFSPNKCSTDVLTVSLTKCKCPSAAGGQLYDSDHLCLDIVLCQTRSWCLLFWWVSKLFFSLLQRHMLPAGPWRPHPPTWQSLRLTVHSVSLCSDLFTLVNQPLDCTLDSLLPPTGEDCRKQHLVTETETRPCTSVSSSCWSVLVFVLVLTWRAAVCTGLTFELLFNYS